MPATSALPDYTPLPDAALVEHVLAGEHAAFAVLMRRYNRMLYRTTRSILRDDGEAEDAVQDTYVLAFRALDRFRGDAKMSTWLTRIAVNAAVSRLRKRSRRAEIIALDSELGAELPEPEATMEHDDMQQPETHLMRAQARELIQRKIDALPESFRTVFVLRAVEEMSVEEVAAVLAIPEATVRTRHFRARSMLRESLSRELDIALEEAFSFDGERCDRIVAAVLSRLPQETIGSFDVNHEEGETP